MIDADKEIIDIQKNKLSPFIHMADLARRLAAERDSLDKELDKMQECLLAEQAMRDAYRTIAIRLQEKSCQSTIGGDCCALKVDTAIERIIAKEKKNVQPS